MTFEEILAHVIKVLQREGRVSYRALQRRFELDDAYLEDLKVELIEAKQLASDENGRILVWAEKAATTAPPTTAQEAPPGSLPAVLTPQEASTHMAPSVPEAERRQLTVLFCDLADSTRLARQLDPEDLREVVRAHQDTCAKVIARFDGYIAQYLGDGLLVYFGYPLAHEDDAQRAVRAGLGMVEAIGQLNTRLTPERSVQLAVRLGVHTGLVVVGEVGGGTRQEQLALGETPNIAARLQEVAAPNTLAISAATLPLLGGFFACQPAGTPLLKGLLQPLAVYRVLYESMARSRLEVAGSMGLTPLVGREQEVRLLLERWAQVKDGSGQVVLLSGEAGIGKSRLVQVLKEQVATEPQAWLTPCQCSPYHQHSALYPWIELLERMVLRFEREEAPAQKLSKVDQGPTARILTLLTFRPDFRPPWTGRSHLTQVTVHRLPRPQAVEVLRQVAHGKALPPEVVEQIVARTDGVPLFVEELTKMVLESGLLQEQEERYELRDASLPPLAIPATLHNSLMARLDRLATVKGLAQLGATLGGEFPYALLQAVSPWDEETVQRGLHQLVEAELLYQRGVPPQATYLFKHALIQDAAYQSLLKSTRQQYHQRIAQALEACFPEVGATQPELVAQHYTEAGLSALAVAYWQRAGRRASERSAYVEALSHLRKGLEVLKTLPDTPTRTQQELELQTTLGPALIATKGYGAPEVAQAYTRARELCRQIGETPDLFPVLRGLWVFHEARAELQGARELAEQLLVLAQRLQDPVHLMEAHRALGNTLFWLGEFAPARGHLEQAIALYDFQQHRALAFLYGTDPAVICLSYAAWALWLLGYPDQARRRSSEALTLAQELSHSPSLANALTWTTYLHQSCRDVPMVQERAEALLRLAAEQGFSLWLAVGTIRRDWALVQQGRQSAEDLARLRQGPGAYWASGAEPERAYWLALLAEAHGTAGQAEEGLGLLREALVVVEKSGVQQWEAELYRLKGELLLQQTVVPDVQQAEACFHQALAIARRQQAKSLELRAAMSLARLWQRQGKRAEAYRMLVEVYGWFTEGFDTADLREAKALLDALQTV